MKKKTELSPSILVVPDQRQAANTLCYDAVFDEWHRSFRTVGWFPTVARDRMFPGV